MTPRRTRRVVVRTVLLLVVAALLVPSPTVQPTTISLTRVEGVEDVDFDDGVVWILALGSDVRGGRELTEGRTDAIQLIGIDPSAGRAAGLGIPRDSLVDIPGIGRDRLNRAVADTGSTDLTAELVAGLTGIEPDYVLLAGFEGYRDMVETIGGVEVGSDVAFVDDEVELRVRRGTNRFDGVEAVNYARSRVLPGSDFRRMANQQQMVLGILRALRAGEDRPGFLEQGTLSVLAGLETDLSPNELYRLAQALTLVRPDRVALCVVTGTDAVGADAAQVIELDEAAVRRIGADVVDDLRYDRTC